MDLGRQGVKDKWGKCNIIIGFMLGDIKSDKEPYIS